MDYHILWVRLDLNNLHTAITRYKGQNLIFMGSGNFWRAGFICNHCKSKSI